MASRQSHTFRWYPRGAIFLSLVLAVAVAARLQAQQSPEKTPTAEPAAREKEQAAPLDRYGDVLPPGAKARLGMLWLQRDRGAHRACFGLTPDGKTIVTFSNGRWLKWWDADTGKLREQRQLPLESPFFIACLSFDGRLLAGQQRGTDNLDVWDVRAGKRVQRFERPKQSAIYWMVFSPDGKTLAAQGSQNVIFLWDIALGKRRSLQGETLAFSPDGKRLASTLDRRVICWDTKKGEPIWQTAARFIAPDWVSLAFTPNGRTLIAAPHHSDDAWQAWDAATGKVAEGLKLPDKHEAKDLAVAPDGRALVFVYYRGVYGSRKNLRHIRLWDLRAGKLLHTLPAGGDIGPFFPDGKSFLSNDGALQRWELATGQPLFTESDELGHQAIVVRAIYSPDGRRLASADDEGMVRLWDVATTKTLHVLRGHDRHSSMAFTPDGKYLITGAIEGKVHIWDAENGKLVRRIPLRDPKDKDKDEDRAVWRLQATADGRSLLVLEYDPQRRAGVLSRWNLATGERKARAEVKANLIASVFSSDGQMLVAGKELLDTATLKRRALLEESPESTFGGCCALSADGRMAAGLIVRRTQKEDKEERLRTITTLEGFQTWDTATGKTRRRILLGNQREYQVSNFPSEDMPLALSPDGRYLAAVDVQGLRVWDLTAAGKVVLKWPVTELMRENAFNLPYACCLCFAPDGRTLAAGNVDSTILIWDLPQAQQPPAKTRTNEPARKSEK
jgi:WD40 repeat protein